MASAFRKMFWGYLFIFLEIHIFIDLLADPIGYGMIYSGISMLAKESLSAKKPKILAQALIWYSLPTVFIQGEISQQALGLPVAFTGWTVYFSSLHLLNIILVFYLCKLLIEYSKQQSQNELSKSTANTLKAYMIVMLFAELYFSFAINLHETDAVYIIFPVILTSLVMHIVFLSHLHRYRKWFQV